MPLLRDILVIVDLVLSLCALAIVLSAILAYVW